MEKHGDIITVLSVALLYTIITSIFSLVDRIVTAMLLQGSFDKRIDSFFQRNTLWIIVTAGIIVILTLYIKKLNQEVHYSMISNPIIRITVGTLAALEGILSLSSLLPINIMSIRSNIQVSKYIDYVGQNNQVALTKVYISNVISVVIILCQIFTGVYLAKFYKSKTN